MNTLLMRITAPLQSWGIDAKFNLRGTERAPTKSGILGMVAAALGRRRNESIDDLVALRFGVRIEKEGNLLRDFHTAFEEAYWRKRDGKYAHVTERLYLSDALFLVGLEGELEILTAIEAALLHPAFPLYLGRRSCPPEGQVSLGLRRGKNLVESLEEEPSLISVLERQTERLDIGDRIIVEAAPGQVGTVSVRDNPLSFDQSHRRYGFRNIVHIWKSPEGNKKRGFELKQTDHDPISILEEG